VPYPATRGIAFILAPARAGRSQTRRCGRRSSRQGGRQRACSRSRLRGTCRSTCACSGGTSRWRRARMAAAKRAMGPASHRPHHARHRWLRADHARHPRRVIRAAGMVWCGWPFVRIGGQRAAGSRPQLDGGFAPRLGRPDSLHGVRRADRVSSRPSLAGSTAARSAIDTNTCLDLEPGTGRLAQVVRSQTTITGIAARFARETLSVWAAAPRFIHQPPDAPAAFEVIAIRAATAMPRAARPSFR